MKKLVLTRETVRVLQDADLRAVVGGAGVGFGIGVPVTLTGHAIPGPPVTTVPTCSSSVIGYALALG